MRVPVSWLREFVPIDMDAISPPAMQHFVIKITVAQAPLTHGDDFGTQQRETGTSKSGAEEILHHRVGLHGIGPDEGLIPCQVYFHRIQEQLGGVIKTLGVRPLSALP